MMIRTSLVAASVLLASAPALAADYAIDPAHSFVTFEVSHIGLSTLHGQFNEVAGTFSYDADNPGASSAKVTVPTESLDTNFAERDKHLKSGDFFDVGAHPETSFESTGYTDNGDGTGVLTGNLTLLGASAPIDVAVTKIGEGEDPWGGYRVGFEGTATIDRTDFGMDYDLGPAANEVTLNLFIEGIRQ